MSTWELSEFTMLVRGEKGPAMLRVAGIVDGVFGLDRRKCYDFGGRRTGYVITHLMTGYSVRHMACNLRQAKQAAAILRRATWDFSTPEEATTDARRMEVVREVNRLGFCVEPSEFEPARAVAAASVDARPEGGDAQQAPFTSSAVCRRQTPKTPSET